MSQWVDLNHVANQLGLSSEERRRILDQDVPDTPTPEFTEQPAENVPGAFLHHHQTTIFHDNFVTSAHLADESVDLVVTSPPYNVGIEYATHDDTSEYASYLEFSRQWLEKAFRVARPDGRLCMNIPLDKNKGGQQSVCADITTVAKNVGWQYHSTIIWNEGNISRRTAWGSWMSASAPYVIAPVEVIVVMYKASWKKRAKRETNITKQEFMDWTNGVWTFNGESKKKIGHPAPFPRELPKRCIKLFSYTGDTVLDPFLGSGTTLLESYVNQRRGIGFDIALEYCQLAQKRLEDLWRQENLQPNLI